MQTWSRHPYAMAQQALTTQAAVGGRLLLGLGPSHPDWVENAYGESYDHPLRHMREYLSVLESAFTLSGKVDFVGETYRSTSVLDVPGAAEVPIFLAALGPGMLRLAGERAHGTITWMGDERAHGEHVVPRITAAASSAGRTPPRIVAGLPVAVCDDANSRARCRRSALRVSTKKFRRMSGCWLGVTRRGPPTCAWWERSEKSKRGSGRMPALESRTSSPRCSPWVTMSRSRAGGRSNCWHRSPQSSARPCRSLRSCRYASWVASLSARVTARRASPVSASEPLWPCSRWNAGKVVSADRLIDELWRDEALANPANSLQGLILQMRRVLGTERVVTRSPGYLLDLDPDAVDALRFERLVNAARGAPPATSADALREALSLWRGPPLGDAGDAPFVAIESSRLEELRVTAIEDRIDADLALGSHQSLVAELQALVAAQPFRERLHGQLMLALYRSGRQADALRAYDSAHKVLVEDLGLSPGPELRRLEAAILAQDPALATPARDDDPTRSTFDAPSLPPLRAPLAVSYDPNEPCVGRDHDLARLAERWEHTHHGNQHAIFIVGEPGIGKTRLTAEFAQRAAAEGAVVLFGRCDEDVLSPFQPFVEAIHDLIDRLGDARAIALHEAVGPHLARLIPGLAPTVSQSAEPRPDEPSMLWFVDALASLLAELAGNTPLLLILDDVHWADSTTVAGLRHVMRRNRRSATLILGTYRAGELHADHPLADLLADLRSDRSCERLGLAGLEEAAIAELLTDTVPDPDQRGLAASRLRRETEGNPLFIGELLRHFADERDTPMSDRLLLLGTGVVPEGITEVIARRLHRVSEPCQIVLRLASILGISFSTPVLQALAVGSVGDVFAALDEAERAGIVPRGHRQRPTVVRVHPYPGPAHPVRRHESRPSSAAPRRGRAGHHGDRRPR